MQCLPGEPDGRGQHDRPEHPAQHSHQAATRQVVPEQAGKHQQSDVVIVQKRPKTGLPLAPANQPLLIDEQQRSSGKGDRIDQATPGHLPGLPQQQQHGQLQQPDHNAIPATEQDRGRFDPDLQVILAVDHGVHGVVDQRPDDGRRKQHPGDTRDLILHRGKRHRHRPAKRHTQYQLRHVRIALRERVYRGQRHAQQRNGRWSWLLSVSTRAKAHRPGRRTPRAPRAG